MAKGGSATFKGSGFGGKGKGKSGKGKQRTQTDFNGNVLVNGCASGQTLRVLYLFAGAPRKADIREYLQKFAQLRSFTLDMREVDIKRGMQGDLTKSAVSNSILQDIKSGRYQVVILSPGQVQWQH